MTTRQHIALFHDPRRQPPRMQWTPQNIIYARFASADIARLVGEIQIGVLPLPDSLAIPQNIGRLERQLAAHHADLRRAAESISLIMQADWAKNAQICGRTANDNIEKPQPTRKSASRQSIRRKLSHDFIRVFLEITTPNRIRLATDQQKPGVMALEQLKQMLRVQMVERLDIALNVFCRTGRAENATENLETLRANDGHDLRENRMLILG